MKRNWIGLACAVLGALVISGCGSDGDDPAGTGSVEVTTWGEEYIEAEIPASVFEDGWSVKYSKFLVVIGKIKIADDAGEVAAEMKGSKLINHVSAGVKSVTKFEDLEAKAYTKFSYEIPVASDDTELGDGATAADLELMKTMKYAVYAEAVATKGGVSKTYKWGFGVATAYNDCKGEKDGKETDGVIVTNGGSDAVELTIHGDHLYYDDLQAQNAKVRFNALAAADGNMDNTLTQDELTAVKLVDIDPANGAYGTGAADDVNDLGAFVRDLSRTVGHFRGEGECFAGDPK